MNPDMSYPSNSDSEAEEVDENNLQENLCLYLQMNVEVDLQPWYICALWTQLMDLARSNIIDTNSTQPITHLEVFHAVLTNLCRPATDLHLFLSQVSSGMAVDNEPMHHIQLMVCM